MKNKLVSFTYTKNDGAVSDREGLIISSPSDNYAMLDITGLSVDEVAVLISKVEDFRKSQSEFYKTVPYKYFTESKITNMREIE